jgi:catechol 2,3-dioxygenase-like lactoylglutathione lyase family enzyme
MTNLRLDYLEFIVSDIARSKAFYGEAEAGRSPITARNIVSSTAGL